VKQLDDEGSASWRLLGDVDLAARRARRRADRSTPSSARKRPPRPHAGRGAIYRDALERVGRSLATVAKHFSALRGLADAVGADAAIKTVRSARVARGEPRALDHDEWAWLLAFPTAAAAKASVTSPSFTCSAPPGGVAPSRQRPGRRRAPPLERPTSSRRDHAVNELVGDRPLRHGAAAPAPSRSIRTRSTRSLPGSRLGRPRPRRVHRRSLRGDRRPPGGLPHPARAAAHVLAPTSPMPALTSEPSASLPVTPTSAPSPPTPPSATPASKPRSPSASVSGRGAARAAAR
jgi:hypothetical protein